MWEHCERRSEQEVNSKSASLSAGVRKHRVKRYSRLGHKRMVRAPSFGLRNRQKERIHRLNKSLLPSESHGHFFCGSTTGINLVMLSFRNCTHIWLFVRLLSLFGFLDWCDFFLLNISLLSITTDSSKIVLAFHTNSTTTELLAIIWTSISVPRILYRLVRCLLCHLLNMPLGNTNEHICIHTYIYAWKKVFHGITSNK